MKSEVRKEHSRRKIDKIRKLNSQLISMNLTETNIDDETQDRTINGSNIMSMSLYNRPTRMQ